MRFHSLLAAIQLNRELVRERYSLVGGTFFKMWKTVQEGLLLKRAFHLTQNSIYMSFHALQDVTEVAASTCQHTPCLSPCTGFMLSIEETKHISFQTQCVCTCCPAAPSAHLLPSNPPPQKGHGLSPCSPATPCDVTLCSYLKFLFMYVCINIYP